MTWSDKDLYEYDGPDFDDSGDDFDGEEDFPFDCHMDRNGQCGKAGSEECDFECPIMANIHRAEARRKAKAK